MEKKYWSDFYQSSSDTKNVPSQFAAFVANELINNYKLYRDDISIFEIGCGNGRDSKFLNSFGYNVIAFDQTLKGVSFKNSETLVFQELSDFEMLNDNLQKIWKKKCKKLFYSRFFLHAISQEEEDKLLNSLNPLLNSGDLIAAEARTIQDRENQKVTPEHYRRFINFEDLKKKLITMGFEVIYSVEGRGLAKYKQDDAFVGRILARKA